MGATGLFEETTPYAPNSPYAASKAGSDRLVRACYETYGLPIIITNCSNNYGPFQFPEKLIPLMLLNAMEGKPLPIYGDGGNVRDWLHVEDHCRGILVAVQQGRLGEKYNIGGRNERTNLQIVERICASLEEKLPAAKNDALHRKGISSYESLKKFVPDRPGHDRRYAIDATKIRSELGWTPQYDFDSGIAQTIDWYLDNGEWCRKVLDGKVPRRALGFEGRRPSREDLGPEATVRPIKASKHALEFPRFELWMRVSNTGENIQRCAFRRTLRKGFQYRSGCVQKANAPYPEIKHPRL